MTQFIIDSRIPDGLAADYAQQLRRARLRVTRPRMAVLAVVHAHPHSDTETIFETARASPT